MESPTYAKIFSQIFDSSIADNWKHRHVFEDLLKLSDSEGFIDMTVEAIVCRTRLPKEMVKEGIAALSSPDPHSRTKDYEGKRLIPIDPERSWGWKIVNYQKYREIKSDFARREYMRDYMKKKRSVKLKVNMGVNKVLTSVNDCVQKANPASASVSSSVSVQEGSAEGRNIVQSLMSEVAKHFLRKATDRWGCKEEYAAHEVAKRQDALEEWLEILRFYKKPGAYPKQSILALFEGWTSELDRARNYDENNHRNSKQGFDRNKGTFNEGKSHNYSLSKIESNRASRVQNNGGLETGANAGIG